MAGLCFGVGDLGYGLVRAPLVGVDADRLEGGSRHTTVGGGSMGLFQRIGLCLYICRLSMR